MHAKTHLCRGFMVLVIVTTSAISTSAQPVLETGRSVRAELRDGHRVSGRLINGDSVTITIQVGGSPVVVNRGSVAALSTRSYRPRSVKIVGTTGAVVAGLIGMLIAGFCGDGRSQNCDGVVLLGAAAGAATGGAFMTSFATSIGAALPVWSDVPASAPVGSSTFSAQSAPICRRDNQWASDVGAVQPQGYSARVAATFFCEPDVRSGIELGYLSRPLSGSGSHQHALHTRYVALVNDRSLGHLPLDPRVLASIQYHNGSQRDVDVYRNATGSQGRFGRTGGANGLGFAVGASAGTDPSRQMSVRVEQRLLLMPAGMTTTLSVGARWRP
jgi:hypothetical protein